MPTIKIHPIATRRPLIPGEEILIRHLQASWETKTPGDKPGIFHIAIPSDWARGEIFTLLPDNSYTSVTTFQARKGVKEDPRKSTKITGVTPDKVASADVIVYSKELLGKDASSDAEYEVIAVRGLTEKPNPRVLDTLLANIFNISGGTPVKGTDAEKLKMIEESFLFWRDKMMTE